MPQPIQETVMTLYDQLIHEGMQEGLQQGMREGLQQGMREGLQQGMREGLQQGMQEGLQQGMQEGLQMMVRAQLARRFGTLPTAVERQIAEASADELERWALRVLDAETLDDVFAAE